MTKKSADEEPKEQVAKRVVAPKRRYFMPQTGESVFATSVEDAVKRASKGQEGDVEEPTEDGDGE